MDALLPAEIARRAEEIGVTKARLDASRLVVLGVLAGAFIALGATFATVAVTDPAGHLPWGAGRVLGGVVFSLGLSLVLVGGAELFTGNALLVLAWAGGRITALEVARNWVYVFLGNAIGALGTALLVFAARTWSLAGGAVGRTMLEGAQAKCALAPVQAFTLGVLCNGLVCLAVWLSLSARSTTDRVVALTFPIAAFVAAGFEHSVANLFSVPLGLLVGSFAPQAFWEGIGRSRVDYPDLALGSFLVRNLAPVVLGNIVGGTLLVGATYWVVYLRPAGSPRR
jgi:formate/nitrite transporter